MKFTLGSDAEVPLVDKNGSYRSAIGLIGGSKEAPRQTEHGFVQEDNVLAEFNVNPSNSRMKFVQNTLLILSDLNKIIKPLDLSINIAASALYDKDQLDHVLARVAGCDPDFDAWSLSMNEAPQLEETQIRSCGGHLHIAFERATGDDMMSRAQMVRVMDLVAGVPSVVMDRDVDRRKLYGKAGAHRPKMVSAGDPYDGVEYRTLSNFWLTSKAHISWAYSVVERAVNNFDDLVLVANAHKDRILTTINDGCVDTAHGLIEQFDLEVIDA